MQQSDLEKLLADTLAARGRSASTQETYTLMRRLFARYLGRVCVDKAPYTVDPEDVEAYQRHLVTERKVGFSSFNQPTCALRFFYRECLDKTDWSIARMPYQRKRRVLPEILAPEEVASGGLRLGETLGLLPSDIDSGRMMIRIEQGKGHKDRCVMLSETRAGSSPSSGSLDPTPCAVPPARPAPSWRPEFCPP